MKKLLAIILSALILVSAAAVTVSAYGKHQNAGCKANGTGFVDNDNNGICDNKDSSPKNKGANYTDADNDGICDNRNTSSEGYCASYTDADNDGICDNKGEGAGTGRRCGNGNGLRCGRNR